MSAFEALQAARAADIEVRVIGDRLALKAPKRPPEHVLKLLEANKRAIITVLRLDDAAWNPEDWRTYYHERVILAEREYPRTEAELIALYDTADRWLAVHPPEVPDLSVCCHCHKELGLLDIVPVSAANGKAGALHAGCAVRWRTFRRLKACAAVGRMLGKGA